MGSKRNWDRNRTRTLEQRHGYGWGAADGSIVFPDSPTFPSTKLASSADNISQHSGSASGPLGKKKRNAPTTRPRKDVTALSEHKRKALAYQRPVLIAQQTAPTAPVAKGVPTTTKTRGLTQKDQARKLKLMALSVLLDRAIARNDMSAVAKHASSIFGEAV